MNYLTVNPNVPTNDEVVKFQLRELGEPICYFGEDPFERRERLSKFLESQLDNLKDESKTNFESFEKETFFSKGDDSLLNFRKDVLLFSIPRSYIRLKIAREQEKKIDLINMENEKRHFLSFITKNIKQKICEMCDNRYLSGCSVSPFQDKVLTYGASGYLKLWNIKNLNLEKSLGSHKYNIQDSCWISDSQKQYIISCDSAANIFLWNNDKVEFNFIGHEDQVNKITTHSSNKYLFSASNDETWRVWDIETKTQVLVQEGHCRPIFGLDSHLDGALVISGDSGGVFRVWDIRMGKSIFHKLAHTQKIIETQFSPGWDATFFTSSQDNYIKIWDLRKMENPLKDNIMGHSKHISKVTYEPKNGRYIISASQDGSVKFWSTFCLRNDQDFYNKEFKFNSSRSKYHCIRNIDTYSHRITGVDIFADGFKMVTVGLDRTIRIWTCDGEEPEE